MNNEVQQWFTFAQKDLAVAKHLRDTFYPEPMEIICYHCQQAAEKAIKGAYLACRLPGGIPRKHDLTFLLEQLKNQFEIPEDVFLRMTVFAARSSAFQNATILGLAARHASTSGCISASGIFAPIAFSAPTPPP